jgi:hypothetical protein
MIAEAASGALVDETPSGHRCSDKQRRFAVRAFSGTS